jgi:putative transposase
MKCGNIKHNLKLSERTYHCSVFGFTTGGEMNAALNILRMGLIRVGKGIPEYTPVKIPLAGYLNYEGISHVSLNQEPSILQGRGCQQRKV